MYRFVKAKIPEKPEDKMPFSENLMKFGVSLQQYEQAYAKDDVTM